MTVNAPRYFQLPRPLPRRFPMTPRGRLNRRHLYRRLFVGLGLRHRCDQQRVCSNRVWARQGRRPRWFSSHRLEEGGDRGVIRM
jgi:hypothetical protein